MAVGKILILRWGITLLSLKKKIGLVSIFFDEEMKDRCCNDDTCCIFCQTILLINTKIDERKND